MFDEMLLKTIKSPETCRSVINDGKYQCTYGQLAGIFFKIERFFAEAKVNTEECCVMRCGNTVPEAIMVLWMLYSKRDLLLLPCTGAKPPAASNDSKANPDADLPEFCKHKLSLIAGPGAPETAINLNEPDSYFRLTPSSNYKRDADLPTGPGNLFLRTSGSTANPKLVVHSNEKLAGNAANCVQGLELQSSDRIIIPVPIYHMYGLGAGFLPGVAKGASICLVANANVIRYMDSEKQFNPNVAFITPILGEMLLKIRKRPHHYRLVVTAGDKINQTTFENFEKKFGRLINLYGSTELGAIATSPLTAPLETRSNGIIEPLSQVEIRLKPPEAKENESAIDNGDMSEIICSHSFGLEAYVDKRGTIISRPKDIQWFQTKDLGKKIDNNNTDKNHGQTFKVMGRTNNSINRNGILVAFSEVESIMERHIPELQQVLLLAKDEENCRGEKLVACCQPSPKKEITPREIRSQCFHIMMRHMVPDEVVVTEIPRLPNGKLDRKKMTQLLSR